MAAPAIYPAYIALEAAVLWIGRTFLTRQVAGVVATGVVAEQAIIAAKETEDVFPAEQKKACVVCGPSPLEHPPVESGPTPFPANSQDLPNRTESPNTGPVGASDTGGQEPVDTGPNVIYTPNDGPDGATVYNKERTENKGGAHENVKGIPGNESHHMPADSVSPIPKNKGPAISMEKDDHRQTASWGNSKEARAYRKRQKELIDQGKFKEAQQMDIDDVKSKFDDKYDDGIKELQDYTDSLE